MVNEVEKERPVIEKQIKNLEPVIKSIQQQTENIIAKQVEENPIAIGFAMPVAIKDNDAARQIIIKEESSGSASVKVYYLSFENGQFLFTGRMATQCLQYQVR